MPDDPSLDGPYSAENGRCAFGHKANAYGRCEPANTAACPAAGEDLWDPDAEPDGRD